MRRSQVLGTLRKIPTEKLALRELAACLDRAAVNRTDYRPRQTLTFSEFAARWESKVVGVVGQLKPSTQANFRSHLRKHLTPFFGEMHLREIQTEAIQQFIATLRVSPKTAKNIIATLRVMWGSARAWGYVDHDPFADVKLPKQKSSQRRLSFTLEEVQRILAAAEEPYRTFYWLAAETGMRAGELCALRVEDLDLEQGQVSVDQSAWHGRISIRRARAESAASRSRPGWYCT